MSATQIIGETAHLHTTSADVRILVEHTGTTAHGRIRLADNSRVREHVNTRAFARITSPITTTVEGPANEKKTVTYRAAVIPAHHTTTYTTKAAVFGRPKAVALKSAVYLQSQVATLELPIAVGTTIKPEPVLKDDPVLIYAYSIDGGEATDTVEVVFDFTLELEGQGYI